jgi:hypothetical protein
VSVPATTRARTVRRTTWLALAAIVAAASPAAAQDEPAAASILLVSQTPWTSPDDPRLRLTVQVTNESGVAIEAPEIGWTLGPRITARDQYEAALVEGPSLAAAADTQALGAPLQPGERRGVILDRDLSEITAVDPDESGVYPLGVELRSAGVPLAELTTAVIHLVEPPQEPVRLSWWTEIDVPIAFGPSGAMVDGRLEEILASRRGPVAQVEALAELASPETRRAIDRPIRFDVVVSPAALEQLEQAADGYRRSDGTQVPSDAPPAVAAADALRLLRRLAQSPAARLHTTGLAAPTFPSLLTSGLEEHVARQLEAGEATFERILREPPDLAVARPPGLAIDEETIEVLLAHGATTVLGAADSVARPTDPLGLAPPPAAVVRTAAGIAVPIVLPDPSTQALLADRDLHEDPALAAQVVLGELATIWREQPVPEPPTERGLALELPNDLPADAWASLVRRLAAAPFLAATHAEALPEEIAPDPEEAALRTRRLIGFSDDYVADVIAADDDVAAFDEIVQRPRPEVGRLHRAILYAESFQYIGREEAGRTWIAAVTTLTARTFREIAPDTSRVLTFTSRNGRIPLRMGDPGGRVLRVRIELRSQRVEFLDTGVRTVVIDAPGEQVTFAAELKASGRSPIEVFVRTPSGLLVARRVLVVSSTAVNPIALIITVCAGLVLVGLWSRRLFRRRTT